MRLAVFSILILLFFVGCISTENNATVTPPENTTNQSADYLKKILFEDVGNNTTKIILVYQFPSTEYNATVVKYGASNGSAIIFVDVTRAEVGLPIVSYKNLTLVVNQTVNTAMVFTAIPD